MAFIYQFVVLIIFSTLLLSSCAGPAGQQMALAAARASKIPRAIRASFRNPEIGVARGFGKRASFRESDIPWSIRRNEAKVLEDVEDSFQQLVREVPQDGIPVEWLAAELSGNPYLARLILNRLIDTNHDGVLTATELLPSDVTEF